jgi:hypothetical protein
MLDFNQRRVHSRLDIETPILFAKWNSEDLISAKMLNISESGMYFESGNDVGASSDVCIWLEEKPGIKPREMRIYDFYRAKVRWLRELESGNGFGIGVKHISRTMGVRDPEFHCAMCEEKIPMGKVRTVKDFLYLCPACHAEIEKYSGEGEEELLRMLEGNVF